MTLKQMVDALEEGRKVGIWDMGYVYLNMDKILMVEDFRNRFHEENELIGELFRRHEECVIIPEEGA